MTGSSRSEADKAIVVELKYINEGLRDLRERLDGAIIELGALRNSEIAAIKVQLAGQAAQLAGQTIEATTTKAQLANQAAQIAGLVSDVTAGKAQLAGQAIEDAAGKALFAGQAAEIMVLKDRAGRNTRVVGALVGAVLSLAVSVVAALLVHR